MSKSSYQIPFDKHGNLLSYPDYDVDQWKDNYVFKSKMTLVTYGRGRSSVVFIFKDNNGFKYPMFVSDFLDMTLAVTLDKGFVEGSFTFVKKGSNYGLKYIDG